MSKQYSQNGLNDNDIQERITLNQVNYEVYKASRTLKDIIKTNCFNYFNYLNIALALLVVLSGHYRNMLFMFVVVFNTLIGIYQEIKAKIKLDRLRLMVKSKTNVIRNGIKLSIDSHDLVLDDLIILNIGDQVPSDARIIQGELLLNESFISGESDAIFKYESDEILAGSFVIGGQAKCRVIRVNVNNHINKILLGINSNKAQPSELKRALNFIIKTISMIIIPLGLFIFLKQFLVGQLPIDESIVQSVAAMVGMIPEGLILLTSVALSVGAVKLATSNTLVQDLYSLEMMARTDVLCLDKTGTLTSGKMFVETIFKLEDFDENIIASIVHSLNDSNQTAKALRNYFKDYEFYPLSNLKHFNPNTKCSGASYNGDEYLMGAYEYIVDKIDENDDEALMNFAKRGHRIIAISKNRKLIGCCLLKDEIRKNAKDIIQYLYQQNVDIKIISGDNHNTLECIARLVELKDTKLLDCHGLKDDELKDLIEETNIFSRVSPKQKQIIIKTLQENGHTVGMMGDGINDVMALKDADFSISVLSAVESAKNVSNIILMDDDFGHIPSIIKEGRRVINNIERTSTLFLIKTSLSVLLSLLTIILFKEYPFAPIQLTLISAICIGFPSFVLSLEPKYNLVNGNFLANILKQAIPSALAIAISGVILEALINHHLIDRMYLSSMYSTITAIILIYNIYHISKPTNFVSKFLIVFATSAYFIAFSFLKPIFYFEDFDWISAIVTAILSITALIILQILSRKKLSNEFVNKIDKLY